MDEGASPRYTVFMKTNDVLQTANSQDRVIPAQDIEALTAYAEKRMAEYLEYHAEVMRQSYRNLVAKPKAYARESRDGIDNLTQYHVGEIEEDFKAVMSQLTYNLKALAKDNV